MREPKPPANERERLAALARYEILDTAPELAYDEIVELAAHICETPIALVSLVDDQRQWFKAKLGLAVDETPRELSLCGHVVETGEPLVLPDVEADERFADNPLVTGAPRVKFYAGAPLRTAEGLTLGSLCVIDHVPRELSEVQLERLGALARLVVRQLDMRRSELARAEAEAAAEAARERAARANAMRQRFFEVSLDMHCVAGVDGYFQQLNPTWSQILGWSVEELCAKPFLEFVHPDDRERTLAEAAALGRGEAGTVHFSNRYLTKSGDYRWLDWSAVPKPDEAIILAAARDVTELKLREAELVEARRAAESASRAKSEFLAKMSHELRTPLNSVIGFTNLLRKNKRGSFDDKELLYLDKIGKNGLHLLSLINDLLDLAKIEAGRTELELEQVDLRSLCADLHDELEGAIAAEGNLLRLQVPESLAPVRADGRRLKQILINLVGNANKFTREGVIELRVHASETQGGRADRVEIVDSGIGIPPAQLERVFEAFRQVSEGGARTHGGTGLGLAISRSLAELHGFDLGVVSVEGEGATFYLKLVPDAATPEHRTPAPASAEERASAELPRDHAPTPPVAGAQRTVLLIEDDSDARLLAAKAVEQVGARVVTADTGESGFAVAQALDPDLILLDLNLPDCHGREVVRRLSKDPQLRQVPVVIYSAEAEPVEGVRPTSVLEKPVSLDEIAETVAQHLGPKRSVLVVDDDRDTREVLCSLLRGLGVDTTEAGDGAEALDSLRRFGADMVLLDICMPGVGGFEFLELLRDDPQLRELPVVVCTALDLEPSQEHRVTDEARAVIRKGFELEGRIEEVVNELFRKQEVRARS